MPSTPPPGWDSPLGHIRDPLKLGRVLWPKVKFYKKEEEIIRSVWDNKETICPAGHMLGKDYTAAFICLVFYLTRHPCRVVTTSVDYEQLQGVLWGEIRNFINTAKYPLDSRRGGPLVVNHLNIRKVVKGTVCGLSYLTGRVAERGEGMSGHHIAKTGDGIPRTLFVGDEVSGIDNSSIEKATEWCNRMLLIGNPYECNNYFRTAVDGSPVREGDKVKDPGGDIPDPSGKGFIRKIIRITAEDSPNVRFARAQEAAGITPTNEIILPGVLPWDVYQERLSRWDKAKRVVGLEGKFYTGIANLLYPEEWLKCSHNRADTIRSMKRYPKAIGIDAGEGKANTSMTVADEYGFIEQKSRKTPDTMDIVWDIIAFGAKWGVPASNWLFDSGGGGKQIADFLRAKGYPVRVVSFGGGIVLTPRRGLISVEKRKELIEERNTYKNRRAQMYGDLRTEMGPLNPNGYGIPAEMTEMVRQMKPIPLTRDGEGKLYILPKTKVPGSNQQTLTELLGGSPDELDSGVLALHGVLYEEQSQMAGAV